jgi:hypothetical protein
MGYMLGKKPARAGAVKLAFSSIFDASKLPLPPPEFGHWKNVETFHMLGNDITADCVWAGYAHEEYVFSLMGGRPRVRITTKDVWSDYAAQAGFDPKNMAATDKGTDMAAAAEYRRTVGILDANGNRHKIDAYAMLEPGNLDQLEAAMYLTGAAGIGLNLPKSAEAQFDQQVPWTIVPHAPIRGGHYVSGLGRNTAGNIIVVTWGGLQEVTTDFLERYCDEALVYLSLEILNEKNLSPEAFDLDGLRNYLAKL